MDVGATLQKKIGPLPAFAWLAVIGGGVWFARQIGQAEDSPSADSPTAVTDAYGDPTQFPAGQLVPITGDEHLAPTDPYVTIPAPVGGGVVILPSGDPVVFQPLPSPDKTDSPVAPPPVISAFGKTYRAVDKWSYLRDWKLDRRRRKLSYSLTAWQRFLNSHSAIVKFFRFGGSRAEWSRVQI